MNKIDIVEIIDELGSIFLEELEYYIPDELCKHKWFNNLSNKNRALIEKNIIEELYNTLLYKFSDTDLHLELDKKINNYISIIR